LDAAANKDKTRLRDEEMREKSINRK